jgi:hypothetical protein
MDLFSATKRKEYPKFAASTRRLRTFGVEENYVSGLIL